MLEALAAAGAFDEIERDRAKAFAAVEPILGTANRAQDEALAGQSALFGGGGAETIRMTRHDNWSAEERLRREFDAIGFFISGHPLDAYQGVLTASARRPLGDFRQRGEKGRVGGSPRRHRA